MGDCCRGLTAHITLSMRSRTDSSACKIRTVHCAPLPCIMHSVHYMAYCTGRAVCNIYVCGASLPTLVYVCVCVRARVCVQCHRKRYAVGSAMDRHGRKHTGRCCTHTHLPPCKNTHCSGYTHGVSHMGERACIMCHGIHRRPLLRRPGCGLR